MTRETHTETLHSGSSRNAALTTKSPMESAILLNTRQELRVNHGDAVVNEVMNADVVMKELMNALQPLRQHFPVTEHPASRGVHHVTGSGWRRLSAIMDSGSAECVAPESIAKTIPLVETEASRQGQTCHTADGGVIKNKK